MEKSPETTTNNPPLFPPIQDEIPYSSIDVSAKVGDFLKNLESFQEIAERRFNDFYDQCVELRSGKNGFLSLFEPTGTRIGYS